MAQVRYRKILPAEIVRQREKFVAKYPGMAEPNWDYVWVRVEDGQIKGMADVQIRVLVSNMDADSPEAAYGLINWVDGMLSPYPIYEFQTASTNERFQGAIEKHFGLQAAPDFPHKLYVVNRYQGSQ